VLLVVAVYAAEDRVAAVLLATVVGVRVSERRQSVRRKRAVSLGGIGRHLIQMRNDPRAWVSIRKYGGSLYAAGGPKTSLSVSHGVGPSIAQL